MNCELHLQVLIVFINCTIVDTYTKTATRLILQYKKELFSSIYEAISLVVKPSEFMSEVACSIHT